MAVLANGKTTMVGFDRGQIRTIEWDFILSHAGVMFDGTIWSQRPLQCGVQALGRKLRRGGTCYVYRYQQAQYNQSEKSFGEQSLVSLKVILSWSAFSISSPISYPMSISHSTQSHPISSSSRRLTLILVSGLLTSPDADVIAVMYK